MSDDKWLSEPLLQQSELDKWSTEYIDFKIEQLLKRIEGFREELVEVSVTGQDLVQLLEALLSIIKKRKLEET